MDALIPKIHSHNLSFEGVSWRVFFFQDSRELLSGDELVSCLGELLRGKNLTVLRRQVHLKTVPFLVSLHYPRKEIYLLSPRAHREHFLLQRLQPLDLHGETLQRYQELKEFLERAFEGEPPAFGEQLISTASLPELPSCSEEMESYHSAIQGQMKNYRRSILERLSDYGLKLSAQHDLIRIHLLKFVALFSSLDFRHSHRDIKRLLWESLRRFLTGCAEKRGQERMPWLLVLGARLVFYCVRLLPSWVLASLVGWGIKTMARRFISGENLVRAHDSLLQLFSSGRDATLDQLGELVLSSEEADRYKESILSLINSYGELIAPGKKNAAGILRAHISLKVSALCQDLNPYAFDDSYGQVAPRLREILHRAKEAQVFVNIDAEHYYFRDMVFAIYKKLLLEDEYLKDYQQTGLVVQAYLRDAHKHLQEVMGLARERGLIMPIRLVKGAYWDAETVEAHAHSYDPPQFINKDETDLIYRKLMVVILKNAPHVQLCLGGHNLSDHCYAEAVRKSYFPQTPLIEHQCLHMTYEALSVGMAAHGLVVRNYVPIGPLLVGISYLVRRIMENCSQVGVLFQSRVDKVITTVSQGDRSVLAAGDYFFSTPPVRLYIKDERESLREGLENFSREALGRHYGGEGERRGEKVSISSPSDSSCTVGTIEFANLQDVEEAIMSSKQAFEETGGWAELSPVTRGSYLLAVAQQLLLKRVELACLICFEAGKTFFEALGDVDEAVDFLHFYARSPLPQTARPRGVVAAVSPWNFPLAIACGMVSAALMAGNVVLFKSAEQTPLVAQYMVDIFHQVGIPRDVLIHLPGLGETVGASLVESSLVAQVVFTGSQRVGMMIEQKCRGRLYHNRRLNRFYPVKVVAEMGGKNAVIITANGDLDEALSGVLDSCYGHAGQKCSACSRILIDEKVVDHFLQRFISASRDIPVGRATCFYTKINPLISQEERKRLLSLEPDLLEEARSCGGVVHLNRLWEEGPGNCVGPLVIELPMDRAKASDSFLQRELFAPVVHVVPYKGLEQALELFNATSFALTGGIYSESQDEIDFLSSRMECGNIYVNRSCTGARVGVEPFGGFKLSGTGPKAGGEDYVRAFTVTEQGGEGQGASRKNLLPRSSTHFFQLSQVLKEYLHWVGGEMDEGERTLLWDFYYWMKRGKKDWQRPNHSIPGQLSYTDFTLPKKRVLMVSKKELHPWTLLSVFSALGAGCCVEVICDGQETFFRWQRIVYDASHLSPFLQDHFFVKKILPQQWGEVLSDENIGVYLLDTDQEDYRGLLSFIEEAGKKGGQMKGIQVPWDAFPFHDFKRYVLQFTEPRSFAVNTMRYGAPLR